MTAFRKVNLPSIQIQYYGQMREYDRDLIKQLNDLITNLESILNRGISFADNVDTRLVSYTSNIVANTEDEVVHTLGKQAQGFIVYSIDKAATVYKGSTTWTTTKIYTKCSAASAAVKILVF